jgi:hypothetical protein
MSPRALTFPLLPLALALTLGCKPKPPKEPDPPPEPIAEPEPPPKKPPPPKCESLDEKCSSKDDTHAKIARSDLVFTPPPGWVYAQMSGATVAEQGDATLAIGGYDGDKDAKKDTANRDAAFADLLKQIAIENPGSKKKVPWKKADTPHPVGDFKLDLWELTPHPVGDFKLDLWELKDFVRGAKKGPLVVVAGPTGEGKGIIIIGFVPADDDKSSDAIVKSIDSLGTAK